MSKTKCEFEWDGIVNNPERKAAADRRAAEEASLRMGKDETLAGFHQKLAKRRRERIDIQAFRYALTALGAGVAAWFVGMGGIGWLAWTLGAVALVLGLISSYGFGRANEM